MAGMTEQDQDYETTQDIENFNANEQQQQLQQLMGGRKHGSRRARSGKGRSGRGRKGGSFLAEITVPVALLAGTQYMKGRYGYGRSKKRNSKRNYRKKSVRRRRR
jgi:hypothetical protein